MAVVSLATLSEAPATFVTQKIKKLSVPFILNFSEDQKGNENDNLS